MWKYGTELLQTNYPVSFHWSPETRMVPVCWQPMVEVTKLNRIGNRNTKNIKITIENANLCGKNM